MGIAPATRGPISRVVGTISKQSARAVVTSTQTRSAGGINAAVDEQYKRNMNFMLKREWKLGDLYAPHDLSAAEMRKWGKRSQPTQDVFDVLNLDPLSLYKNFSIMSDFISDMGRIRPAKETGLRPVNQRKVAKALRRAVALGLMPSIHKHPELLKQTLNQYGRFR
jgi:small subunit ribosomal protein S18